MGERPQIGIIGFLGIAALGGLILTKLSPDSQPAPSATEAKAHSDDVLEDAAFLKDHPKYAGQIITLIRMRGYECPALVRLYDRGESPDGMKFEALCGPSDGTGDAYKNLHYAVYPSRLKVSICEPFDHFWADCT